MRSRFIPCLMMMICLTLTISACSGSQGECTYDTDCQGLCQICDTAAHECVNDPVCQTITQGECENDSDCDPLQERCVNDVCVPIGQDSGPDGDSGPSDGDSGGDETPEACLNPLLDCTVPQTETEVSQGRDRDHDDWGECCDCDDGSASVNPSRAESIYNCKDDDCNPDTPDDDLDHDGYGSILRGCDPGSDCNDSRHDIHPGADEVCDGVDNTCTGEVDAIGGETVCVTIDCADISGRHWVEPDCMSFNPDEIDIAQDGCNISFTVPGSPPFECVGTLDELLNLYLECGGLGIDCTAKISLTQTWVINCSLDCTFVMIRTADYTECSTYSDSDCTDNGQRCGVLCDAGNPVTGCVNTIPGGRQPGYYCDPDNDIECANEFCNNSACSTACVTNADCSSFSGTSCQPIGYYDCENSGGFNACVPENSGETACHRTNDCAPGSNRYCTYRKRDNDVSRVCRTQQGSAATGDTCTNDSDCASGMCVCNNELCSSGSGKCSEVCSGATDCPGGAECGTITIQDLNMQDHSIPACVWSGDSCGRDADCPSETPVCAVGLHPTEPRLITFCSGRNESYPESNISEPCSSPFECWSYWCAVWAYPSYCAAVCLSDSDCPTFDAETTCVTDADCDLGYLCENGGNCLRKFECRAGVFFLGVDEWGQDILDAIDMCEPLERTCQVDTDCRSGEACKVGFNEQATAAQYRCQTGGPGTGVLGDDCFPDGAEACFTSLCLLESGGGPGMQYCSLACLIDDDCGDPENYRCAAIAVATPFGQSQVPACVKR
jgi:putative metal-binding protein